MNITIYMLIFSKYILYVCLYIYIINIHSTHTYIYSVNKTFILDANINRLTALIKTKPLSDPSGPF